MSSFSGQMKGHKSIAIDRFDGTNLQCTMFFLSHCHTDHMIGLKSQLLLDVLHQRSNCFLYCSEVTRLLLLAEDNYTHLKDYIIPLDVGVVHHLKVPSSTSEKEDYYVKVTLIPAGHCPGSVMFLFEGPKSTSLYTGDFRWEISQASKIPAFRSGNRLKTIDTMYVDTTFCIPEAYHIPSRSECLATALTLVSDWIKRSFLHVVNISCPAKYGYENFLTSLAQKIDCKVHVPEWKVLLYEQIPELKGYFTSDPNKAQIHACSFKNIKSAWKSLPCGHHASEGRLFQVLNIRLSTMWFTSQSLTSRKEALLVAPKSKEGLYRVCYSMHSSYSEIRDLVSYLQPRHIMPTVLPVSDKSMDIVQTRLSGFINYPRNDKITSIKDEEIQPLGILQKLNTATNINHHSPIELVFDSPEVCEESFKTGQTSTSQCFISELCHVNNTNLTPSEVSTHIKENNSPCCSEVPYKPEQLYNKVSFHENLAIINNDQQSLTHQHINYDCHEFVPSLQADHTLIREPFSNKNNYLLSSSRVQEKISSPKEIVEPKCFHVCAESDSDLTLRSNHLASCVDTDSTNQINEKYTSNVNSSGNNVNKSSSDQLIQDDVGDNNKSSEIKPECEEVIPNSQESKTKISYFVGKNKPKLENQTQSVKKIGEYSCKVHISQGSKQSLKLLNRKSREIVVRTKNIQSTSPKRLSLSADSKSPSFNLSKRKLRDTAGGAPLYGNNDTPKQEIKGTRSMELVDKSVTSTANSVIVIDIDSTGAADPVLATDNMGVQGNKEIVNNSCEQLQLTSDNLQELQQPFSKKICIDVSEEILQKDAMLCFESKTLNSIQISHGWTSKQAHTTTYKKKLKASYSDKKKLRIN